MARNAASLWRKLLGGKVLSYRLLSVSQARRYSTPSIDGTKRSAIETSAVLAPAAALASSAVTWRHVGLPPIGRQMPRQRAS
jgi:hypothetical protein